MLQSVLVGFDASAVWGAAVSRGLGGPRLRGFNRVVLPAGVLEPDPADVNVARPTDLRDALLRVAAALGVSRTAVTLVLPDGVARIAWLRLPGDVAPLEFARYRLLPTLPYPADEAIVDAMGGGPAGAIGAAVRRRVVEEYEQAADAAGLRRDRVDLAPLAALAALRRDPPPAPTVDVVLSDVAVTLAAGEGRHLRLVRNRRRAPGVDEPAWLAAEVDRTAAAAGLGPADVRVVGSGARAFIGAWTSAGRRARPGWEVDGPAAVHGLDTAGLGAALA